MEPTTPYEAFLASQEQEKYPLSSTQLSALRTFFSDPSVPVSQIAKQIAEPLLEIVEKIQRGESCEDRFGRLWRTIADAVRTLTSLNDRLVELVVELQRVEDPSGYIGAMCDFNEYWQEFAFDFKDPSSTDPERDTKRQAWINMNLFCAKLSTYNIPQLDQRRRAGWPMRHTLEKTPWEHLPPSLQSPPVPDDPEDPLSDKELEYEREMHDVKKLNTWVPVAAVWIQINARGLYEMEGPMPDERDWIPTNWKGEKGWSKERYAYWRARFEAIGDIGELEETTRELAKEAARIMRDVEMEGNV